MTRLEKEQEELLSILVEAARALPREKRDSFLAYMPGSGSQYPAGWGILHDGLPGGKIETPSGDLDILKHCGLIIAVHSGNNSFRFNVSPSGFEYYEKIKKISVEPLTRIEENIRNFLDADNFRKRHLKAYTRWIEAESKLWGSDSREQFTTIGHICREAMQEFVSELVELYKPSKVDTDISHTKSRLKSVISAQSQKFGDTENIFFETLINYWGALNDLVQRQEHGTQKVGQPLIWEDGRRLVFQTAITMFEIDRSLLRIAKLSN